MFNEIAALNMIKERFGFNSSGVFLGIGDDCSALRLSPDRLLLLTADTLVEGVHFFKNYFDPTKLAKKSVAVSVSDIAAMGGVAKYFMSTLGVNDSVSEEFISELLDGFNEACIDFQVRLIGGNITSSGTFFIDITVAGEIEEKLLIRRSGAKPGDLVFITGTPGDSALGFQILKTGSDLKNDYLISRHVSPKPKTEVGRKLAESSLASSMIDVSDGVLIDLERITVEYGLGADIFLDGIPLSSDYIELVNNFSDEKYKLALSGGEDYELLFTSPRSSKEEVLKISDSTGTLITEIGCVTDSGKVNIFDSSKNLVDFEYKGYIHIKG